VGSSGVEITNPTLRYSLAVGIHELV
jgi:hypothetical protein